MKPGILHFLWLCFSAAICFPAFCQNENIVLDSLKRQLIIQPEDTSRVQLFIQIGQQYEGAKPDSAMYFYQQAGKLSDQLQYPAGQIQYIANYTQLLNYQGKYDQALQLNLKAVEIAKKKWIEAATSKIFGKCGCQLSIQSPV